MASYRLTEKALVDLDTLFENGILNFGLQQANGYFDGLVQRFQDLAEQPLLYPAVDDIRQGYRRSVFKSHSIYYRIDPTEILIVRILGQQNPDQQL